MTFGSLRSLLSLGVPRLFNDITLNRHTILRFPLSLGEAVSLWLLPLLLQDSLLALDISLPRGGVVGRPEMHSSIRR